MRDPRVDLVFSHNLARYVATGVDPNDAQRLIARIERWEDWCRVWSEEAARHEALAKEATDKGRAVTAAEAYVRAAIYYHCGKHLFSGHADDWRAAQESMVRCLCRGCAVPRSAAAAADVPLPRRRYTRMAAQAAGQRASAGRGPGAGARRLQGGAAPLGCAFIARGMAALTIDGPG